MKRKGLLLGSLLLAFSLTACDSGYSRQPSADSAAPSSAPTASGSQAPAVPSSVPEQAEENGRADTGRRISVTSEEGHVLVFALHDSTAADELYRQLPLSVPVENYGSREKIFYPPEELDVGDSPSAQGPAGTLAYYAPWGNVAIFYGTCEGADGLYQLGEVVSGEEYMAELTGDVRIEAADVSAASTGTAGGASASSGQTPAAEPSSEDSRSVPAGADRAEENAAVKMHVQVGDATFTATLEDNAAADALAALLQASPVVLQLRDFSGFEKVGPLGTRLPTSNLQITTQAGDIMLYDGDQIVLFYGSNSWSYTRLGWIDDLSGWTEALGGGDVTVTLSMEGSRLGNESGGKTDPFWRCRYDL